VFGVRGFPFEWLLAAAQSWGCFLQPEDSLKVTSLSMEVFQVSCPFGGWGGTGV
jgi:hypothetical protein